MSEFTFSPEPNAVPDAPIQHMNPGAAAVLRAPATSRSQRELQQDMETQRRRLEASGMLRPATIINFNPVPLRQDGLITESIPAAGNSDVGRVEIEHNGQLFVGHAVTIRSAKLYSAVSGWEADEQSMTDQPKLAVRYVLPIGLVYSYYEHYSGTAHDSPRMGGVLIYEGDRHTLSPDHLSRSDGQILVPEPVLLPKNQREYTAKPKNLDEVLDEVFTMQSLYIDEQIQRAHSMWSTNDPMQQKQITDVDRLWARFGKAHGMFEELPPWVQSKVLSGAALANVVRCPVCQKPRPFANVYMCPDCKSVPYDAYEAFMAGMQVADAYIDTLPDEQLDAVMVEKEARKRRVKAAQARATRSANRAEGQTED